MSNLENSLTNNSINTVTETSNQDSISYEQELESTRQKLNEMMSAFSTLLTLASDSVESTDQHSYDYLKERISQAYSFFQIMKTNYPKYSFKKVF